MPGGLGNRKPKALQEPTSSGESALLTDEQIAEKFGHASGNDSQDARMRADILRSLKAGKVSGTWPAVPSGKQSGGSQAGSIGKSVGLQVGKKVGVKLAVQAGLQAAPVVGQIAAGLIELGSFIKGLFTGHHKAAVQAENTILGTLGPQVDDAFRQIDAAFASGQSSDAQIAVALDIVEREYSEQTASIRKEGGGKCNAACWYHQIVRALVFKKKQQFRRAGAAALAAVFSGPGLYFLGAGALLSGGWALLDALRRAKRA